MPKRVEAIMLDHRGDFYITGQCNRTGDALEKCQGDEEKLVVDVPVKSSQDIV
jgi:hypothetical protein